MRVGHLNVSRAPWYDRTTGIFGANFNSQPLAPHGETTRVTYTVPTGVRSFLDLLSLSVHISNFPTASGEIRHRWKITTTEGGTNTIFELSTERDTTPQIGYCGAVSQAGQLRAGDQLLGTTQDGSTGGSWRYTFASKQNEYAI